MSDDGSVEGDEPGFVDANARDDALTSGSPARGIAGPLAAAAAAHPVEYEYVSPSSGIARAATENAGAFE